jgi:hypothetical protein
MAEFYRVEKNGKGPYAGENSVIYFLFEKKVISGKHFPEGYQDARPTPSMDNGLSKFWTETESEIRQNYVFGFSSFDAIFSWFSLPEEIEFFEKYGFSVVKYEACDIIKGEKQAIARSDSLMPIESISF